MRSSFVAIALALTLTSVLATYTTNNYVKAPVAVVQDDDLNFTNKTSLSLASITVGDLHLLSILHSKNSGNSSASNWNLWWKKLDAKTFTSSGDNFTAQFTNPQEVIFYNNYAIGLDIDNDTGIPQVRAYQVPLTGGAALPRLQITSNNNQSFTPKPVRLPLLERLCTYSTMPLRNRSMSPAYKLVLRPLEWNSSSAPLTKIFQLSPLFGVNLCPTINSLLFGLTVMFSSKLLLMLAREVLPTLRLWVTNTTTSLTNAQPMPPTRNCMVNSADTPIRLLEP